MITDIPETLVLPVHGSTPSAPAPSSRSVRVIGWFSWRNTVLRRPQPRHGHLPGAAGANADRRQHRVRLLRILRLGHRLNHTVQVLPPDKPQRAVKRRTRRGPPRSPAPIRPSRWPLSGLPVMRTVQGIPDGVTPRCCSAACSRASHHNNNTQKTTPQCAHPVIVAVFSLGKLPQAVSTRDPPLLFALPIRPRTRPPHRPRVGYGADQAPSKAAAATHKNVNFLPIRSLLHRQSHVRRASHSTSRHAGFRKAARRPAAKPRSPHRAAPRASAWLLSFVIGVVGTPPLDSDWASRSNASPAGFFGPTFAFPSALSTSGQRDQARRTEAADEGWELA